MSSSSSGRERGRTGLVFVAQESVGAISRREGCHAPFGDAEDEVGGGGSRGWEGKRKWSCGLARRRGNDKKVLSREKTAESLEKVFDGDARKCWSETKD